MYAWCIYMYMYICYICKMPFMLQLFWLLINCTWNQLSFTASLLTAAQRLPVIWHLAQTGNCELVHTHTYIYICCQSESKRKVAPFDFVFFCVVFILQRYFLCMLLLWLFVWFVDLCCSRQARAGKQAKKFTVTNCAAGCAAASAAAA